MLLIKYLSIFVLNFVSVKSGFLEAKSNFLRPHLERNNIVNKRVWVKNARSSEKSLTPGHFIFRPNSLDAENNNYENNIEQFDGSSVQSFSLFPNYMDRTKRSYIDIDFRNPYTANVRDKRSIQKDSLQNQSEDWEKQQLKKSETLALLNSPYAKLITYDDPSSSAIPSIEDFNNKLNLSKSNESNDDLSKIKFYEDLLASAKTMDVINKSDMTGIKYGRDVLDKMNMWQTPGIDASSFFTSKTSPSSTNMPPKSKPMTERGLVKILSLLAKFFQKMSRQHEDVKRLHKKLISLNDDFIQNIDVMSNKLHNFDIKYLFLLKLNENIKQIEAKIKAKEKDFDAKNNELAKYVKELEMEQKKFLVQQQQFYNVQKLLLMQNEKITSKQNMIARTQVEISRRQNNFARLLKKSRHTFANMPKDKSAKEETTTKYLPLKIKATTTTTTPFTTTSTTTGTPTKTQTSPTVEPIKINLFSITPHKTLENNDEQILKEKDEKSVDDLIYKYYFNNTFIDNLIKKKILADFLVSENNEIIPNAKNKRNGNKTTVLLPLLQHAREKRWIRHHATGSRKRNRGKTTTVPSNDDVKIVNLRTKHSVDTVPATNNYRAPPHAAPAAMKLDPFRTMATNFCNEIGQNNNEQTLKWCIEKALRKLKFMNTRFPFPDKSKAPIAVKITKQGLKPLSLVPIIPMIKAVTVPETTTTPPTSSVPTTMTTQMTSYQAVTGFTPYPTIYFPDNDQLETYLQQFDLKPDTEGTVYFEGSVHASELGDPKSDGVSDIMPEQDDHAVIPMNPRTLNFDRQAQKLGFNIHNSKLLRKLAEHKMRIRQQYAH